MHKELISVIIPVYNAEEYIEKSVESVVNQTYENLEIILIDDGSTDSSGIMCDSLAKGDNRIKVIHKNNGGAADARNYGLSNSTGEYVCFVDSDDYVSLDFVEKLYDTIVNENADISVCDYLYAGNDGTTWKNSKKKYKKNYTNTEALEDMFSCKQILEVMLWNKLFKKSLFVDNKIEFPIGKMYEDNFTMYKLFYFSKKITLIPDRLYYYVQTDTSVMRGKFNEKKLQMLQCLEETKEFLKLHNCNNLMPYYNVYSFSTKRSLINGMILDNYDINKIQNLRKDIKSEIKNILFSRFIDAKMKIKMIVLAINYKLFLKLFYRNKN